MSAIELQGVGKRYLQQADRSLLIKRLIGLQRRARHELWALRDINFAIEPGATVGVIGRNGSGKTTLLRLLSGVSAPTTGRVRIEGRIAPLIGVGIGFNQELSGRENVFVNGQLLGMSEPEVRRKFDDIVDFAEMSQFIDTPVKYYSSGMFMRLGFSVAIHNEPDVLVVDEVLAVGDGAFQLKSFERMRQMQRAGTTIVIVTHNLQALHQMADRTILLSHGQMVFDGATEQAMGAYQELLQQEDAAYASHAMGEAGDPTQTRVVGGAAVEVELLDDQGVPSRSLQSGRPFRLRITAKFQREVERPGIGMLIGLPGQTAIFTAHTPPGAYPGVHGPDRPLVVDVELQNRLLTRNYTAAVMVVDRTGNGVLGTSAPLPFYVTSPHRLNGVVDLEPKFTMSGTPIELPVVHRLAEQRE